MAEPPQPPTLWQTIASVLASFFGVQSAKNRARDFQHGRPVQFIAIGLLMTIVFVILVIVAVRLALRQAGL